MNTTKNDDGASCAATCSALFVIDIGNYRGDLFIRESNGRFWWAVECDYQRPAEWDWKEIPEVLFRELRKLSKLANAADGYYWQNAEAEASPDEL